MKNILNELLQYLKFLQSYVSNSKQHHGKDEKNYIRLDKTESHDQGNCTQKNKSCHIND